MGQKRKRRITNKNNFDLLEDQNMKTWFKFYGQEYLSDPKMLSLTPVHKALWLTMLCLASASKEEGVIRHISDSKIMTLTGIETRDDEWQENEGFLSYFEDLEMITLEDKKIIINNFDKRQETNLTNAERQAKFRKSHKNNESNGDDVTKVTESNAHSRYESNARIEKNRKESIYNTGKSPEKNSIGEILQNKYAFPKETANISTPYQEKAFRYAKGLSLPLSDKDKPRFIKIFRDEHLGLRKTKGSTDQAYSFLKDYDGNLSYDDKLNFFFSIYENGLNKKQL